jgi:hypothetical protein
MNCFKKARREEMLPAEPADDGWTEKIKNGAMSSLTIARDFESSKRAREYFSAAEREKLATVYEKSEKNLLRWMRN